MPKFSKPLGAAHSVVKGQVGQLRNRHTVAVVKQITSEALSASSVVVVRLAKRVAHLALAIVQKVAIVARSTGSSIVPGLTIIRDGYANSIGIEDPSVRALKAQLIIPVPSSAANI